VNKKAPIPGQFRNGPTETPRKPEPAKWTKRGFMQQYVLNRAATRPDDLNRGRRGTSRRKGVELY